jgi:hypothetical protein
MYRARKARKGKKRGRSLAASPFLTLSELADPVAAAWMNDLPSGAIDQGELDKVLLGWGSSIAVTSAIVPEPSSILFIALGLVSMMTLQFASSVRILCRRGGASCSAAESPWPQNGSAILRRS